MPQLSADFNPVAPSLAAPACAVSAPAAVVVSAPASPSAPVPLASLAELEGIVSGVVGGLAASLRADIGRLEAGWQDRWQQQQAASTSQAAEVTGRLQGMAAELAAQRTRLDAVEQAQQARQAQHAAGSSPAKGAPQSSSGTPPAQPASDAASSPASGASGPATVDAILRRSSLLETRVGAQLEQIENACVGGAASPRSAPVSPVKSGPWGGPTQQAQQAQQAPHGRHHEARSPSRHFESRAAQAAAVAAALVYGQAASQTTELSSDESEAKWGWGGGYSTLAVEAALPASPRIPARCATRPASAAAGCYSGDACKIPGGRPSHGSGPAARRSRAVDAQVAETHAIIAGIQGQIAAIKTSLAHASGELDARRQEGAAVGHRLDRLERTDRHMVKVEASNLAGACALERRVRGLEERVAAAARQAAAGGVLARETSAALGALQWRVDQSADATIGTIKAIEARQDQQRAELHSVAATATLADAKTATLASEVARLQRRVHSGPPNAGGGSCGKDCARFRLY